MYEFIECPEFIISNSLKKRHEIVISDKNIYLRLFLSVTVLLVSVLVEFVKNVKYEADIMRFDEHFNRSPCLSLCAQCNCAGKRFGWHLVKPLSRPLKKN